jgi:hypothetical protein
MAKLKMQARPSRSGQFGAQMSRYGRSMRILYWVLAAVIVLLAMRNALISGLSMRAPDIAMTLSPYNATAVVARFDRSLVANDADQRRILTDVKSPTRSLTNAPLDPGAFRVLALAKSELGKNPDEVRRLMQASERLSRRDLAVQLWLIEDAVARNDPNAALVHYDRALSVHPDVSVLLFPVMAGALDAEQIIGALAPYLRAWRPWIPAFMEFAVNNAAEPRDVLLLLRRSAIRPTDPKIRPYERLLLAQLVVKGRYKEAHALAVAMAGTDARRLSQFDFSGVSADPDLQPFSWTLGMEGGIDARPTADSGLEISVSQSTKGVAASRVVYIQPGRHIFTWAVDIPNAPSGIGGSWAASCLSPKGNFGVWNQDIPDQAGTRRYRSQIDVPDNCPALIMELAFNSVDSQFGATIKVRSVDLRRIP